MKNLLAEMVRNDISVAEMANFLGVSEKTMRNKLQDKTDFTYPEATKIRDHYFSGNRLEYLFASTESI